MVPDFICPLNTSNPHIEVLYNPIELYYYVPGMTEIESFLRCRNCGRIVKSSEAFHSYYCSEECSFKYRRCKNCGNYFPVRENPSSEFCSLECEYSWKTPSINPALLHHYEEEKALI
jgi:predicted nucleic acid-binding Zn ribbon protein